MFGVCVVLSCFRCFCFLFPFASLNALALSLTGAQRTDSSSAKKILRAVPMHPCPGRSCAKFLKRIPNYKQPLVVRNASQGVGFHRVERLRKQKTQLHCSQTVGPFPHRKTRETSCSPATVWLAHAMYYVGLLSAVPSKKRPA